MVAFLRRSALWVAVLNSFPPNVVLSVIIFKIPHIYTVVEDFLCGGQ